MPKGNKIFGGQAANFSLIKQINKHTLSKVRAVQSWHGAMKGNELLSLKASKDSNVPGESHYLIWSYAHLRVYHASE